MKIGPEHVGRWVFYGNEFDTRKVKVCCIVEEGTRFHGIREDGTESFSFTTKGEKPWELLVEVEEAKKPSERLQELIGPTRSDPEWQERAINAIFEYLDEQFEKENLNGNHAKRRRYFGGMENLGCTR